jgi:hypothetical protein
MNARLRQRGPLTVGGTQSSGASIWAEGNAELRATPMYHSFA